MAQSPTPVDFIAALRPALREASAIAAALEGRVANEPKRGELRAAKAALTIADHAAQEAILVPLFEHFPNVRIEAEEDTTTAARFPDDAQPLVVVDPIDGTLHCYLGGLGPYAVLAGLARDGRYEAALVALPRERLLFDATRGDGAHLCIGDGPPTPARAVADGDRVFVSPELREPIGARLRERGYQPVPAAGGAIAVAPLVPGVRAGLRVVVGRKSISTQGRIGLLIAREAGAQVLRGNGEPFPDDLHSPARRIVVAPDESTARDLLWALGDGEQ
jgi:fructose-1,6-bisphosphatase/inositol monophosphatase family enzyme